MNSLKPLERIAAILVLLLVLPLLVIIALAVKLGSPGPVFFRSIRLGFDGTKKETLHFRTTYVVPKSGDTHRSPSNDFRVPKVGAVLRKTSLYELPQVILVALGRFSFLDLKTSNNPLYTRVASGEMEFLFMGCLVSLSLGGAYYWLSPTPHPFIYGVLFLISVVHLADLVLIFYRYKTKAYGNSAQELQEVLYYLQSQKSSGGGGGNNKRLYPAEEDQVLDIDNKNIAGGLR